MADLLQGFAVFIQLWESQSYTAWKGPEATGYTPCFGKPLLFIVLMPLPPVVPKEQALLTLQGQVSPRALKGVPNSSNILL